MIEDQDTTIILPNGQEHVAFGSPNLIYDMLLDGQSVLCRRFGGEFDRPVEYFLRLLPNGAAITYTSEDKVA